MASLLRLRLLAGLLVLCACGLASAQDKIDVVNEGGIKTWWTLAPGTTLPVPAYPAGFEGNQAEVCVAIGYLINADGTTSDFSLLKFWSANEPKSDADSYRRTFAQDASNALARWKFAPRADVSSPKPVYTVATFMFAARSAQLRERCAIPNLMTHILDMRYDRRLRDQMSRVDIFNRLKVDPSLEMRYRRMQEDQSNIMQQQEELRLQQQNSGGSSSSGNN